MNNLFKYSKLLFNTAPASPDDMKEAEQGQEPTSTNPEKTDTVQPRKIMEDINERVDMTLGGLTIEEIDRRMDARIQEAVKKAIKEKILKGEKGDKGDPGPKGDALKFSDLSDAEKAQIKGEKGDMLKFEDLTDTQKSELKGEKGDMPDFGALDDEQKKKLKQLIIDLGFGGIDAGLGGTDAATKNRLDELETKVAKITELEASLQTLDDRLKTITQIDPQLVEEIREQLAALKDLNVEGLKDIPERMHETELSLGALQSEVEARSIDPKTIKDLNQRITDLKKLTDDFVDSDADNKDQINKLLRNYKELQRRIQAITQTPPATPKPAPRTPRTRKPATRPQPRPGRAIQKPLPAAKPVTEIEQPNEAENEKNITATKKLREKLTIQVDILLTELNSANITDVNKKLKLLSRIENFKLRLNSEEILDVNGRKNLSSTFLRLKKVVIKIIYELNKTEDYTKTVPEIKIPNQMKKSPETIVDNEEYTKTPNPIPGKKKPETSEEIKKDDAADAKETLPPGEIANPESTNK